MSEWMPFAGEDVAAHVRSKSGGKEFILGLAELEPVDERHPDYRPLDDYAVVFVHYR